jgi:hypothetical protein
LRAKPCAKEACHKQGNITHALQDLTLLLAAGSIHRIGQHERERFQLFAFMSLLIERIGARKGGQHIDQVVFGMVIDGNMLMPQRMLHGVVKEFAQIHDGNGRLRIAGSHHAPRTPLTGLIIQRPVPFLLEDLHK